MILCALRWYHSFCICVHLTSYCRKKNLLCYTTKLTLRKTYFCVWQLKNDLKSKPETPSVFEILRGDTASTLTQQSGMGEGLSSVRLIADQDSAFYTWQPLLQDPAYRVTSSPCSHSSAPAAMTDLATNLSLNENKTNQSNKKKKKGQNFEKNLTLFQLSVGGNL